MALRDIFARFSTVFDAGPLEEGSAATDGLVDRLQTLGNLVAGAAIVQGIRSFASEFVGVADEIGDTAAMLGMSTDALQSWRHAAQLSGVEASQLDGAFVRLQDQMAANSPVFRQLGVSVRDANGELRSAGDVLSDLADPIAALPTDAERTGTLMDLLGRSGARLGPLFSRGAEGIAEVRGELEALGGGVTPEAAEAAGELDDAMVRLDTMALSLKSRLAVFLLPTLKRLSAAATAMGSAFTVVADRGRIVQAALVVLGAAAVAAGGQAVVAWVAAAAPFVVLGALVLGLILVVEDLWVGFEGGKSVIGDLGNDVDNFTDNIEGLAAQFGIFQTMILAITGAWLGFRDIVRDTAGALAEIAAHFSGEDNVLARQSRGEFSGPTGQQGRGAMVEVRRIRAERAAAAEAIRASGGDPNSVLRAPLEGLPSLSRAGGRPTPGGAGGAGTQITQSVSIGAVHTEGMSPEQATAMVQRAVQGALARQAADTADTLAGPWDRG